MDKDIFDDFDEFEQTKSVSTENLQVISELAQTQLGLERKMNKDTVSKLYVWAKSRNISVPDLEGALNRLKKDLNKVRMFDLPEAMDTIGMKKFELAEGGSVEVKSDITVKVLDKEKFHSWLIRKGFQALVKNKVEVQFPKEGRKSAKRFVKYLQRYYASKGTCNYKEKEEVHSQTLKAHVKKQRAAGTSFPSDLIDVFEFKFTKIK